MNAYKMYFNYFYVLNYYVFFNKAIHDVLVNIHEKIYQGFYFPKC
jgi:hypothetical protein